MKRDFDSLTKNSPKDENSPLYLLGLMYCYHFLPMSNVWIRIVVDAQEVSRVLPDAIRLRARQDNRLLASMLPITQEALALSIKQSPQLISDSIAPILGSAIRKAISRAMREMLQSLNQTLEYTMSWQGLQWRWEAWKTGRPFGEVVLLHTLRFRVEQVFLIHKKTGFLLNHVMAEGISSQGKRQFRAC